MGEPIEIHPYDQGWPALFTQAGAHLRSHLGRIALRIDHIGSTAVPGLAAKPIIDIQISVAALEPVAPFRRPLEASGLRYVADNPELTKRYFREQPGARRTHVHVRRAGAPSPNSSPCSSAISFARTTLKPTRTHDTSRSSRGGTALTATAMWTRRAHVSGRSSTALTHGL